jgi:hypothetical protein
METKDMVDDFIESGKRLMDKLKKLLKAYETPMLKAGRKRGQAETIEVQKSGDNASPEAQATAPSSETITSSSDPTILSKITENSEVAIEGADGKASEGGAANAEQDFKVRLGTESWHCVRRFLLR